MVCARPPSDALAGGQAHAVCNRQRLGCDAAAGRGSMKERHTRRFMCLVVNSRYSANTRASPQQ